MHITLLGTGTSHGIPVIGCSCSVCTSADPHDNRLRASAWLTDDAGTSVVIDTGPEFRIQALRYGIRNLDALLITHSHADHLHGLDDIRTFAHTCCRAKPEQLHPLPLYTNAQTISDIQERFSYIFRQTQDGGGKPLVTLADTAPYTADNPLVIGTLSLVPVPVIHGTVECCGWCINGKAAYITDCNYISDESVKLLQGIEYLIVDGLRAQQHQTHFSFDEVCSLAASVGAEHTYITHICHAMSHAEINRYLAAKSAELSLKNPAQAAYDGMCLKIEP